MFEKLQAESYVTLSLFLSFKSALYDWILSLSKVSEIKLISPLLHFSFYHLASSLCSHESKIDHHIVQQLYLRANCHFAWVQNAYYGCTASIWNDCRLQTQWLVTVVGGYGMSLSLSLSLSLSTKPTILPRLHSLTPHPWLTTKFC